MTNMEIQKKIMEYQAELQRIINGGLASFELNQNLTMYKNKINTLRDKCSHLDDNGAIKTFNSRCIYCGKRL